MDHRTYRELAAGDALDDLSGGERLRFRLHARWCGACAALRRDLDDTIAMLSLTPVQRPAPDALRAAVLRSIASGSSASTSGAPEVVVLRRQAGRLRAATFATASIAALLAVAVIGLGIRTVSLSDRLATSDADAGALAARVAVQEDAMAVALDPHHATASLDALPAAAGASASVVYAPGSRDAFLVAQHLPATPTGHVYQLWFADDAGVHPLGTFTSDGSGVLVVSFGTDLAGKKAAMVTLEPDGGATGAPGPEMLFGTL
jgi:hypothetical protein